VAFRWDMNGAMKAGVALGAFGLLGWIAGASGIVAADPRYENACFGVVVFGAALYFVGRVVQMVQAFRSR
jgi:uncharacterized membrane protein YfcA